MEKKRKKAILVVTTLSAVGIGAIVGYKFGYHNGTKQLSDALLEYFNSNMDWEPDIVVMIMDEFCK